MQLVKGRIEHFGTVDEVSKQTKILGLTSETTTSQKGADITMDKPVIQEKE